MRRPARTCAGTAAQVARDVASWEGDPARPASARDGKNPNRGGPHGPAAASRPERATGRDGKPGGKKHGMRLSFSLPTPTARRKTRPEPRAGKAKYPVTATLGLDMFDTDRRCDPAPVTIADVGGSRPVPSGRRLRPVNFAAAGMAAPCGPAGAAGAAPARPACDGGILGLPSRWQGGAGDGARTGCVTTVRGRTQ